MYALFLNEHFKDVIKVKGLTFEVASFGFSLSKNIGIAIDNESGKKISAIILMLMDMRLKTLSLIRLRYAIKMF